MTRRVVNSLRVLRAVAERRDPTAPVGVGTVARDLGASLSAVSRLCTELEAVGALARGEVYGSYRLGPRALRLSGRAAAPFATVVRFGLTLAAQRTGETTCLAARTPGGLLVVAAVGSAWTLHSPAAVGELVVDERSALVRAVAEEEVPARSPEFFESTVGECVEVAAPVRDPSGDRVAVVAVRLPVNRSRHGLPRARRAVDAARRSLEGVLGTHGADPPPPRSGPVDDHPSAVEAAFRLLEGLAAGPAGPADLARGAGLRPDRTQRLLDSCVLPGVVETAGDGYRLGWNVHGWYRAATAPTLVTRGAPLVAEAAGRTGVCAFITVLQGMRSLTVVEELEQVGEGVVMMPWLGRPHPVIGSDGGPTLVMDFTAGEIDRLLGHRHTAGEMQTLQQRVRRAVRDGVVSVEAVEEGGLVSVSAPVRDAAGSVAAAACLVGTARLSRARVAELQRAAGELAGSLERVLLPG